MTIKPINYNLTFEPDLEKFTLKGKEILTFKVNAPTKSIELDSADLKIANCKLLIDKKNIVTSFMTKQTEEKLLIHLSRNLKIGEYKLFIEFQGALSDKLAGFYRSKYIVDEKEKYLATTQFEAADARRTFPCIDHPLYKATFDVSFIIDKNLTAISNTLPTKTVILGRSETTTPESDSGQARMTKQILKQVQEDKKTGKKLVVFERTPKMSTYLLYLGVGEFEFLEGKYKNVLLRIETTPGKKQYGKFALECAQKSLKFFEEYFGYTYPLKKLDLIAIPDFASGAMENWGAITFRENALLFYPDKSSKATMQRIAGIIAHEIAHQWFGNLVTMKWWDDLWLNESFATYMANKVLDHYWPEWDVWSQYVTDTVFEGMALDSLKSSHPIKVKVRNTSELDELFDEIAYEKGGSILRMLDLYLGKKEFRDGLRMYLKKFQYKNAEAEDLWQSLESVSDKPVVEIMQKYITQIGFPVVDIRVKDKFLFLSQERFLFNNDGEKRLNWEIPLYLKYDRLQDNKFLLKTAKDHYRLPEEYQFIYINKDYSGFFISNYSKELLQKLGKNISFLKHADKLGMIHDLFALILAGKKDLKELYRCIDIFFVNEKSSIVLHYIISKLTGIYLLIKDDTSKKLANEFAQNSLKKLVGYQPKKNENILDTYLRTAAFSSLTIFDDKKVAEFVDKKFMSYLKDEKSLHPDLRSIIYSSSIWFNDAIYEIIKNLYRTSSVQEEKVKLLSALGNSKNKKMIKQTLEYVLDKEVTFSFLPYAISSTARNPYAKEIVLNWLMEAWPELLKRSGGLANMLLRRILQSIIPTTGIGKEKEVEEFLQKNKIAGLERTVEQVSEELRINSRFVNKYKH